LKPDNKTKVQLVETVKENKNIWTQRQVESAKRARELMHALVYPAVSNLKCIIKVTSINNCPVTTEDLE